MEAANNPHIKKRIFIWSTRRVLSNAFHRAVWNITGCSIKHFCEPFALPFYFGPTRKSVQFEKQQEIADNWKEIPTHASCQAKVFADVEEDRVFVKEHAMYCFPPGEGSPEDICGRENLENSMHTFIIRHPEPALKSLWRQVLQQDGGSFWDRIVKEEVGFKEQADMYDYVTKTLGQETLVIDSEDFKHNPKQTLRQYCEFTGLPYSDAMIDFENEREGEKPWDFLPPTWISDVNKKKKIEKGAVQDETEYPEIIWEAIRESMPHYEKLLAAKMKLRTPPQEN